MTTETARAWVGPHPFHGIHLGFPAAFFGAGALADIAYVQTSQIQWTNFAQWLNAGGMVFCGVLLAWSLVELALRKHARGQAALHGGLLALAFVLGLVNAFQHSRDGWSSVGAVGVTLSILTFLLTAAAAWVRISGRAEVAR